MFENFPKSNSIAKSAEDTYTRLHDECMSAGKWAGEHKAAAIGLGLVGTAAVALGGYGLCRLFSTAMVEEGVGLLNLSGLEKSALLKLDLTGSTRLTELPALSELRHLNIIGRTGLDQVLEDGTVIKASHKLGAAGDTLRPGDFGMEAFARRRGIAWTRPESLPIFTLEPCPPWTKLPEDLSGLKNLKIVPIGDLSDLGTGAS